MFSFKETQERFLDLPFKPRKVRDIYEVRAKADSTTTTDVVLPGTLSASHALIRFAMRAAVEAGRLAYRAGRMGQRRYADPSSPLAGLI